MEIPIIAGRETEWRDRPSSPPVAVVSELFGKLNFGQQNPLGQHIVLKSGPSVGHRKSTLWLHCGTSEPTLSLSGPGEALVQNQVQF